MSPRVLTLSPLFSCGLLAVVLLTHCQEVRAQSVNGYAEQLRPKATRPGPTPNAVYAPIKKPVDEGQVPEIEMFVGESRVFPTPGVGRIAVGNGAILTAAALDNKEIILFANGVGTSSLFVWNEDGRYQRLKINIVPGDTSRYAREIAAFLTTIPKAKASIIGDKVIVEGDDLSDSDLNRIDMLAQRYPQIVNFTNRLGFEQMVMLDVKVVEFPVTELRELGLKWSAVGGAAIGGIWLPVSRGHGGPYQLNIKTGQNNEAPIIAGDAASNGVPLPRGLNILGALNLGLNATLNALAQEGKTTVLAEPQLSARNGSKASFLAGGEFPYAISTINGPTIQFKPYGVKLEILPRVDRNGTIRATIDTEFSQIDASVSTPAGPALLSRKTNTEFNVRNGETIVLSGLVQRENSTNIDKVPFLGDVPVLGALFRSKKFQNKETELVIFVTPTVVDSRSPGVVDRIQKTSDRLQERLGALPNLTDPLQPGSNPGRLDLMPAPPTSTPSDIGASKSSFAPVAPAPVAAAHAVPFRPIQSVALEPAPFSSPQGSTLSIKLDGLVVRALPDDSSQALLQLGLGSVVTLGDKDPQPAGLQRWRNIVAGEVNGWIPTRHAEPGKLAPIHKRYTPHAVDSRSTALADTPPVSTAASLTLDSAAIGPQFAVLLNRLAMRLTPDVNAPALANLAAGQVVRSLVLEPRGAWSAVEAQGKRGWVATQWLQPVAAGGEARAGGPANN
jgi:pilus assembly protein CpaC